MTQADSAPIDMDGTTRVACALAMLDAGRHELTLCLHTDLGTRELPLTQCTVAADARSLSLQLRAGERWPALPAQMRLTLCARQAQQFQRFQGLEALECVDADGYQTVRCTMPDRLTASQERQTVRLPVVNGLHAGVRPLAEDTLVPARILDLSVGGCLLEMAIGPAMLWQPGQALSEVTVEGPDGERIASAARVRHVHAAKTPSLVRAGLEFVDLPLGRRRKLGCWMRSIEREAALRRGGASRMLQQCAEFITAADAHPDARADTFRERAPMVAALDDIAGCLGATVIALRNNRELPVDALKNATDTLCSLLASDRQAFLYALCCLHRHPPLLQHSIAVAGRLADLVDADDDLPRDMRPTVLAALVHDLGKAMLADRRQPSDGVLTERQKRRLHRHVEVLLNQLGDCDWLEPGARRDIIERINERLDGRGYPGGLGADQLAPLSRAANVVDVVDAMTRARGDRRPFTSIAVYRELYNQPQRFDRHWVTRYVQRHGMHPIGTLVHYSGGFLAWVMRLGEDGQPRRVRLVRNLAGRERPMDEIFEGRHIAQLGKLEGPAPAHEYGLTPF